MNILYKLQGIIGQLNSYRFREIWIKVPAFCYHAAAKCSSGTTKKPVSTTSSTGNKFANTGDPGGTLEKSPDIHWY